jgi:hypothetical protein
MGVEPYSDGIQIFIEGKAKSPILLFEDPSVAEAVAAMCGHYLS